LSAIEREFGAAPYSSAGAVSDVAGRLVFTDRSRDCGFEGRNSFALAAGHFHSDRVRRRAVPVHIEHEAGGAGVISIGGGQLFDGRRRRRIGLGGLWWCLGSIFGICLFSASAAEPAGPRAAGQQGEAH